jgi:large subunit ribosomal protein L4
MELPVYDMAGKKVSTRELPASIFEANINRDLMHQALVRQLANARLGTHKVKTRSEVDRTTAKVYRQKGTGRARHGSRKAPIFVGGGKAHGPLPRKYVKNMPRKMRRAALCSALSVKAGAGDIVLLDQISLEAPKTKEIARLVETLTNGESTLLLMAERNEIVEKSSRNLAEVKVLRANYLNVRDLLGYNKIVMPLDALDAVAGFLEQDMSDDWHEAEEGAVED